MSDDRRSLGTGLGGLFGTLRGSFNPFVGLRNFGRDFKSAAGYPIDAPLWTKSGGIQLGNMPTVSQYTLNNTLNNAGGWKIDGIDRVLKAGDNISPKELSMIQDAVKDNGGFGFDAAKDVTASGTTPGNGVSLGTLANWGMGIYQGGKAINGLINNAKSDTNYNSLKRDIESSIASNPMYDMYMDAADERLLREMRNGTATNGMGGAISGLSKGIPAALLSALGGFAVGGIPGAAINGIGSLLNSGISGYRDNVDQTSDKLQGLYERLRQAQSEYKTMKRPRGLGSAGLSTQYFNQLY